MATFDIRLKALLLLVLTLLFCGEWLHAAWQIEMVYSAVIAGGTTLSDNAVLGEHASALEGFDPYDIQMPSAPPMNPSYVRSYFPHTNWGAYNCNLKYDIRSGSIAQKTWSLTLQNSNVVSTNYSLSWVIPALMPDYYQPKLIINSVTYNMRTQNSYSFASPVSSCSIRLDVSPGVPYLLSSPPEMLFSNNQAQSLNLAQYFAVTSGNLSYSFTPNANLVQSLVTINDSLHWQVSPVPGYIGTTTANVTATGTGGSKTANILVTRDATNSPPQYNDAPPQLSVQQNSFIIFSWAGKISDPDLDNCVVAIQDEQSYSVVIDSLLQQAIITPNPGYKGCDTLYMVISDNVSPALNVPVYISVLPSTPAAPQNLNVSLPSPGSVNLSWSPVNTDISGLPLTGVTYQVLCYADPACTVLLNTFVADLPQISLSANQLKQFYKVISINE